MNCHDTLLRNARRVLVTSLSLVLFPLTSAAITFDVIFEAVELGTPLTGTITYAAINDPEPTSYSFTDGVSTWATGDCLPSGPFETAWTAGVPAFFGQISHAMVIQDCASPPGVPTDVALAFGDSGIFLLQLSPPDSGPYSFVLADPIVAPALHPLGIAILGSVMGAAGFLRLRS